MKKSDRYQVAMRCVLQCELSTDSKIEILDQLLSDKKTAEWSEEQEVKNREAV